MTAATVTATTAKATATVQQKSVDVVMCHNHISHLRTQLALTLLLALPILEVVVVVVVVVVCCCMLLYVVVCSCMLLYVVVCCCMLLYVVVCCCMLLYVVVIVVVIVAAVVGDHVVSIAIFDAVSFSGGSGSGISDDCRINHSTICLYNQALDSCL